MKDLREVMYERRQKGNTIKAERLKRIEAAAREYVDARQAMPPGLGHPGSGGSGKYGERIVRAYDELRAALLGEGEER